MDSFRQIKDEIYVRCVCGAMLNETDVVKHIDCFIKEDFIKNTSVLKISRPGNNSENPQYACDKCIRCGHPMSKDKGALITLYPPIHDYADMQCSHTDKQKEGRGTARKKWELANNFYEEIPKNVNRTVSHINTKNEENSISENIIEEKNRLKQTVISEFFPSLLNKNSSFDSENMAKKPVVHNNTIQNDKNSGSGNKMGKKCGQKQTVILEFFQNLPNKNVSSDSQNMLEHHVVHDNTKNDTIGVFENRVEEKHRWKQTLMSEYFPSFSNKNSSLDSENQNLVVFNKTFLGPSCKSFHIALLPNCRKLNADSSYHANSLLLQVLDPLPSEMSVCTQTDLSNTKEIGVQVNILGIYPEEVEKLLASMENGCDLAEFDPAAEAAYLNHQASLIPCKHCSRRFSPDRILKHTSCCIKRPRTRSYAPPKIQVIPRYNPSVNAHNVNAKTNT